MMAWLLPWRRRELLWSSKWCNVNSFKSSSDCCWDQVVEGKGGIRDVAGGLYDACERCLWLRSGQGWLDSNFLLEAQLAGFVGQQVVWTELLVTKVTPMILVWASTHTHKYRVGQNFICKSWKFIFCKHWKKLLANPILFVDWTINKLNNQLTQQSFWSSKSVRWIINLHI